ncbi:MAG: hypothetical protein ACOCRO_09565 [Halanaerobiales bacterium]
MDYRDDYNFVKLHEDAKQRIKEYLPQEYWIKGAKLNFYYFSQTWGNTSLGWGGIAGQAMTTAQTVIFLYDQTACIYIYIYRK